MRWHQETYTRYTPKERWDFFGDDYKSDDERFNDALRRSYAKEARRKQAEKQEEAEMIAAGYKKVTNTEWEEEWDGEGGEYVTRTKWVKVDSDEAATEEIAPPPTTNTAPEITIEQYTAGDNTWDAAIISADGTRIAKYGFTTEADAQEWANNQIK